MTNLKRIIDEKGVQQRWLAEQVGVTEASMSRYVNGERIPKAPMAIRMADVLGVDVKELYGWDDKHVVGEAMKSISGRKTTAERSKWMQRSQSTSGTAMDGKQGRNIGVDGPDLGHRSVSDIQRIKLSAK